MTTNLLTGILRNNEMKDLINITKKEKNAIAKVAQDYITQINVKLADHNSDAYRAFNTFVNNLRNNFGDSITEDEAMEMLVMHALTEPITKSLFGGEINNPIINNPISKWLEDTLEKMQIVSQVKKT